MTNGTNACREYPQTNKVPEEATSGHAGPSNTCTLTNGLLDTPIEAIDEPIPVDKAVYMTFRNDQVFQEGGSKNLLKKNIKTAINWLSIRTDVQELVDQHGIILVCNYVKILIKSRVFVSASAARSMFPDLFADTPTSNVEEMAPDSSMPVEEVPEGETGDRAQSQDVEGAEGMCFITLTDTSMQYADP